MVPVAHICRAVQRVRGWWVGGALVIGIVRLSYGKSDRGP